MNNPRARFGLLLIGILALSGIVAVAAQPAPLGLIIDPEPDPLSVSIWTNKSSYVIGENATIFFSISQPAYVYIYDIQPDGIVRLIFPNAYSQNNYVSAGTHSLPDGLYKFTVAPPTGTEQLQIIASPLSLGLEQPFSEPFPMVGPSPSAATDNIQAHIMGIVPEPDYATAWTSFLIVGSYGYTPPTYYPTPPTYYPTPPTYNPHQPPPFPGVSGATWYFMGGQWYSGMPGSGPYWYWYNPCGYSYAPCGIWRIRIRISLRFGIGFPP